MGIAHDAPGISEFSPTIIDAWGPLLEIWEGNAVDHETRYLGSSGGVATAIALFCLERDLASGVLHVGKDQDEPWRNRTQLSRSRQDLISNTGSRYSPGSPCEGLGVAETAESPLVFIGKPCDIQGLRKAQELRKKMKGGVGLAIGIFCAGTPSTRGLLELLKSMEIAIEEIEDIRFRGKGWPGEFSVGLKGGRGGPPGISYAESWGFLNKYRPFRCYICPDGTSEFADLSCGDPWYRQSSGNDPGKSMVLVRTIRGQEILHAARKAGYVSLEKANPDIIELSQSNLLEKRRAVWGRIAAMKAFGLPVPQYPGFPLLANWKGLPLGGKCKSLFGTMRRIVTRRYYLQSEY
jgi:coenzyme F420 hydrogenase subunit beta